MAAQTFVLGMNCKAYRNTGTYGSPTWDEITNIRDLTLKLEAGDADVSRRASAGWRERLPALRDASVEFDMVWATADTDFQALLDAYTAGSAVGMLILDQAQGTAGSEGLRAAMGVFSFTREEPLEQAAMAKVSMKPMMNADAAPAWHITS